MLKKIIFFVLLTVLAGGTVAYFNQIPIMLALIKVKSSMEYDVAPNRRIEWNQGPAVAVKPLMDRAPNIILIVADDLGYNDISTFGGGVAGGAVKTPNIDQLANAGAVFRQSYSGAGTCAPSRAMLMTGRYPTRTGFEFTPMPSGMGSSLVKIGNSLDNGLPPIRYFPEIDDIKPPFEEQGLPAAEVTVAELLKERGYQTFHIGKWHLGRGNGMNAHEQGFDQSLLMVNGLYLPADHPDVVNAKLPFDPVDQFLWARLGYANSFNSGNQDRFEPAGYLTDYWTDESIKVIKANKNNPFFLYLAHWGVHTPLQATREDYEAVGDIKPHRLRVYAAMIRALDRSIGRINAALEAEGLAENTIVMFTSDNGGPGYIGLSDINQPFRGWKLSQFEGGLRVPLFMKWPARISAGTVSEEPVAHIDMMPTLVAAAEADLPAGVGIDGVNLLPLATQADTQWSRKTLFWQSADYKVVRHGDWKLQVTNDPGQQWLFDLAADPTEHNNLFALRPDKVAELYALLDAHHAQARPALYPSVFQAPVALDKTLAEPFDESDEMVYWPN